MMTVEFLFLIALVLLVLEVFIVSMGVLGFLAFLSFSYGLVLLHQSGAGEFYGLGIEAVAAIGLGMFAIAAICGYFAMRSFKKDIETGLEHMMGKTATVKSWKGGRGIVTFEGEDWRAISDDPLNHGATAVITDYHNMTLTVKKED